MLWSLIHITSIYAHILDEDRKVNAQKFETAFYAKPDLRNVRPPEEPAKSEPATLDLESSGAFWRPREDLNLRPHA